MICPCVITLADVLEDVPDLTLYPDPGLGPVPTWWDPSVMTAFIATYRGRICGLNDCKKWIMLLQDRAYLLKPKYDELWMAYQKDLLDFSTSKARTSVVTEHETHPDTGPPYWIVNQGKDRDQEDTDGKLTIINPISSQRYLSARMAEMMDYAGSSGLSTNTNLDDINHFRDNLTGFITDFCAEFEDFFVGRY